MWEVIRSMQHKGKKGKKIFPAVLKTIIIVSLSVASGLYILVLSFDKENVASTFFISIAIGFVSILIALLFHRRKIVVINSIK
jgi:uncharacterized membrane protein YjjB (DUF3815 family)